MASAAGFKFQQQKKSRRITRSARDECEEEVKVDEIEEARKKRIELAKSKKEKFSKRSKLQDESEKKSKDLEENKDEIKGIALNEESTSDKGRTRRKD